MTGEETKSSAFPPVRLGRPLMALFMLKGF